MAKQGGTHALRKRCPNCKKLRRFYEPPGDQGGTRPARRGWLKDKYNEWVCPFCVNSGNIEINWTEDNHKDYQRQYWMGPLPRDPTD